MDARAATRAAIVTVAAAIVAGCTASPPAATESRPTSVEARDDTAPDAPRTTDAPTAAVTAGSDGYWGSGRALAAATAVDATTAIVTTTEVHVVGPDGATVELDTRSRRRDAIVAISSDATLVATARLDPPTIDWYDVAATTPVASLELPAGAQPSALHFVAGTTTLLAETAIGPLAWAGPPGDDTETIAGEVTQIAGESALRPDGSAVTPLLGTRRLTVLRGGAFAPTDVELPANGSFQRVAGSPDGTLLAAEAAVGESEFDRPDQLFVLDPAELTVVAAIALGRDIPSRSWTVADDGIAVAIGDRVEWYDPTGDPAGTANLGDGRTIAGLSAVAGGLVGEINDGGLVMWPDPAADPIELLPPGRLLARPSVSADGRYVTVTDSLGGVHRWSGDDGSLAAHEQAFETGALTDVAIAADGSIAAGSTIGRVVLTDAALRPLDPIRSSDEPVRVDSVAFRPGDDELATGRAQRRSDLAFDDTLTTWRIGDRSIGFRSGGEAEDVAGCAFFFHRLAYTADGALLATSSHDFTVAIVDADTGDIVFRLPPRTAAILDLAFTPGGDRLVVSADDNRIEVWETDGWTRLATFDSAAGGYSAIAMLPDAATIVAGDVTGGLVAIDLATGETTLRFDAQLPARPSELSVDPTGGAVAAPLLDGEIGVWSTATGELLARHVGHTDDVTGLAFSPGGDRLVSASADGTLRAWEFDGP